MVASIEYRPIRMPPGPYLAWKCLDIFPQNVPVSPIYRVRWEGGRAEAFEGDVEYGFGIHAGTWANAHNYTDKAFLVAPYWDGDGKIDMMLAQDGWRSSRAQIVCGPFNSHTLHPPKEAARLIVSAAASYPQVPGVVAEALLYLSDGDLKAAMYQGMEAGVPPEALVSQITGWSDLDGAPEFAAQMLPESVDAAWTILVLAHIIPGVITDADEDALRTELAKWPPESTGWLAEAILERMLTGALDNYAGIDLLGRFIALFPSDLDAPRIVHMGTIIVDELGTLGWTSARKRNRMVSVLERWPAVFPRMFVRDRNRIMEKIEYELSNSGYPEDCRLKALQATIYYLDRLTKMSRQRASWRPYIEPILERLRATERILADPTGWEQGGTAGELSIAQHKLNAVEWNVGWEFEE